MGDKFDWKRVLHANIVYLELSPDEQNIGVRWRLGFTPASLIQDVAERLAGTLETDFDTIMEIVYTDLCVHFEGMRSCFGGRQIARLGFHR